MTGKEQPVEAAATKFCKLVSMLLSGGFWLWLGNPKAMWALLSDRIPPSRMEVTLGLEGYFVSLQDLLVECSLLIECSAP